MCNFVQFISTRNTFPSKKKLKIKLLHNLIAITYIVNNTYKKDRNIIVTDFHNFIVYILMAQW